MEEYSFLPEPQTEIRKYMGIISISQKMKNSSRSREQKTPRILVSRSRSQTKYSRTLRCSFQDIRTTIKPRKAVNTTSGMLRPSTPRWKLALMAGIQETFSWNWNTPATPADLSKTAKATIAKIRGTEVKIAARYLVNFSLPPPKRAIRIAPTSGRKIIHIRKL